VTEPSLADMEGWIKQTIQQLTHEQYMQTKLAYGEEQASSLKKIGDEMCLLYNRVLIQKLKERKEVSGNSSEYQLIKALGLEKNDMK
jgi:hypothetical protein